MHYLLKRIVVGVCVAVVMMFVHKAARATDFYTWSDLGYYASTPDGACIAVLAGAGGGTTFSHTAWSSDTSFECWDINPATSAPRLRAYVVRGGSSCASGTYNSATGVCVVPPNTCPAAGTVFGSSSDTVTTGGTPGIRACMSGCEMSGSGSIGRTGASGSYNEIFGPFVASHVQCDGTGTNGSAPPLVAPPAGATPAPPNPCPAGTKEVGVDSSGIAMCSGTATPPTVAPPVTTVAPQVTNGDGSKTDVTTTVKTNADGSTTTTTTTKTTATNGGTSTTTTNVTGNIPGTGGTGTVGGLTATPLTKGKEDNPNDLCTLHPDLNVCRNSAVSGTCDQTACEGDAITCSMLRQQRKEYCENTTTDANKTLGDLLIAGNDPLKGSFPSPTNGATVAMPSSLSSSTFLGSACFADKVVTVRGFSIALPYSKACDYLVAFRYALMFVVLMLSFRMISGVIFRE